MARITIDKVTKRFGPFTAVDAVDISFADGQVTCLLGPSGCGKTTLMRMIAGLEQPTGGRILFGDRDVTGVPTRRRNVGMVFQYPVMYPTLSVRENIGEPLRHDRSIGAAERDRRIDEMLDILDLHHVAHAVIGQLDAGLRQKVAVGRAVARHSEIVLFDEPTTNVEVNAKLQLIRAFKDVTQRLRQTIVYVTHDQTEAMTLADKIALMKDGRIVQYAAPRALYDNPTTVFGGWFLGNPGMNFLPAALSDGHITAPLLTRPLPAPGRLAGGDLTVGVRPERIRLHDTPGNGAVSARLIERTIGIAGRYLLKVDLGGTRVSVKASRPPNAGPGDEVYVSVSPNAVLIFADGERVEMQ